MKTPKAIKKDRIEQVVKIVKELKPIFFLEGWDLVVEELAEDNQDHRLADMTSKNQYREAILKIYPAFYLHPKEEWRAVICHELCHIITSIQQGIVMCARDGQIIPEHEVHFVFEEETSWMSNIINKLLPITKKKVTK